MIGVRVQPDLMTAIDQFITEERPGISRPEAVRLLAREALEKMGLIPPK